LEAQQELHSNELTKPESNICSSAGVSSHCD